MKLVGFLQMYNEVATGNLVRCLESLRKYCDDIVIYDDGSTDNSVEVAMAYTPNVIVGNRNDFGHELFHKQSLLEVALSLKPDWIFWMDCDEVIEAKGERGGLRYLCENPGEFDSFAFHEVNLWRNPGFFRLDNSYNDGVYCRLWRNTGKLRFNTEPGLHKRQVPQGLEHESMADLQVIHYGFASNESIVRKYKTYKSHGQRGWELDRLIDERTLAVARTKTEWFNVPIAEQDPREVFKFPVASLV